MINLDEFLQCKEHEAPYLIINLKTKKKKHTIVFEFTVICPIDQKMEQLSTELLPEEGEKLSLPLADKIFRCEKCFREVEILDIIIEKAKVIIYLSCIEHGRLITREISSEVYDKIKFAWDMKDVKKEEEKTY